MGLLTWLYALVGLFIAIESKIMWQDWTNCSMDWLYKLLNIAWVILTTIWICNGLYIFELWLLAFLIWWLLKEYCKKKYFKY